MATITSATSGLASAPSTWVGGVVPGTTFAGSRTVSTFSVSPVGTTALPTLAGAQTVTLGKMIRLAGDPNFYRVATGLAANASGNIVIDAPGLLQALPSGNTTVSVDLVDDKVIIAHPGGNAPNAAAQYVTSGALAIGATTIPLVSAANSILAGECVQLEIQVGTTRDGKPLYHNAYYKVATGITGPGSIVIEAPGLLVAAPAGARVRNRGHVVTVNGTYCWGDDTSATVTANNAIVVTGALIASRSVNSKLTCRGTLQFANGVLDYGIADIDEIPESVNAAIVANSSVTLSAGKHVIAAHNGVFAILRMAGAPKVRNTRLTSGVSSGGVSITVDDSAGWKIGDTLVIASPTYDGNLAEPVVISGGASPTWTISPALVTTRPAQCRVGNFSSNVSVSPAHGSSPTTTEVLLSTASVANASEILVSQVSYINCGSIDSGGWTNIGNSPAAYGAVGAYPYGGSRVTICDDCSSFGSGGSGSVGTGPSFGGTSTARPLVRNWAIYGTVNTGSTNVAYFGDGTPLLAEDMIGYRICNVFNTGFGPGSAGGVMRGSEVWARNISGRAITGGSSVDLLFEDGKIHSNGAFLAGLAVGKLRLVNSKIDMPLAISPTIMANGQSAVITTEACEISPNLLVAPSLTSQGVTSKTEQFLAIASVGDAATARSINRWRTVFGLSEVVRHGQTSMQCAAVTVNETAPYAFTIPAIAGVPITIKPSLRFDATYGTATPPVLTLVGQGVNETFTCPATADTWHEQTMTFTPTTTGDITATLTIQSASTAGFAWLDGLYTYPMIQSVRHYGFQFLPQSALVVDNRITLTEAAALALPVAVDHTAQTITVTGAITPNELGQACIADLCQTANLARTVHCTFDTQDFATSYTVVGALHVSGAFTDAVGRQVKISIPGLAANTRVWLYDSTAGALIANVKLSSTGLVIPLAWTTDRVVLMRAGYAEGALAKERIEGSGVLTRNGLSFAVTQVDNEVYNSLGIDGASLTEFTPVAPNLQINAASGVTTVQRIYVWSLWAETSELGIAGLWGAVSSLDGINILIDQTEIDARLQNTAAAPLKITGGSITRRDGGTVVLASSNSIQLDPGRAYLAAGTSGGGASAADVWAYSSRTLTADPGAAAHAATQTAIAALPAPLDAAQTQGAAAAALIAYDPPTMAELSAAQAALAAEHGATQSAVAAIPTAPSATSVASAVRSEIATELARLDAAVTSRAAPGAAMTLTSGERAALAAQIEAAILADGDGQAFVAAIVSAINNTNVDQAVLIAAIRADIERGGGMLATRSTLAQIEASTVLAKEATVASRESETSAASRATANQTEHDATQAAIAALPSPPNGAAIAGAVRAELGVELANIDAPISSRAEAGDAMTLTTLERQAVAAVVQGSIGSVDIDEVSLVAAIRADIERAGGLLDATATQADVATIGDPLTRAVPGGYPAGSAGEALGRLVIGAPDAPIIVLPGAPADTSTCRVYGYVEGADNRRLADVVVTMELHPTASPVASERMVAGRKVAVRTDSEGRLIGPSGDPWVDLQRNDLLTPLRNLLRSHQRSARGVSTESQAHD